MPILKISSTGPIEYLNGERIDNMILSGIVAEAILSVGSQLVMSITGHKKEIELRPWSYAHDELGLNTMSLRALLKCIQYLELSLSEVEIRIWFFKNNENLDGDAPYQVLRDAGNDIVCNNVINHAIFYERFVNKKAKK